MKTRPIAVALLLAFAPSFTFVAITKPAFAQDDASTKAARARFQEGVEFYDKGQYENARAAFLQAYALRKHPAVLLNLAQSSLRSGHHLEAAKYFQQYLREASNITAAQRSDAERGLTEARAKLGRILIDAPRDTEIFVDDDRVGTTPMSPVDVEPGTHAVRGRIHGDETVQITVGAGQVVTAKFAASGASVVAAPASAPPAATASAPPPKPAPPREEPIVTTSTPSMSDAPAPSDVTADKTSHPGLLSPPRNLAPVVIFGSIAVAGFGTAVVMAAVKANAQSSADAVANQIRANLSAAQKADPNFHVCSSTVPADVTKFGRACKALSDDNDKVNKDATVGNIALGVGIGSAALAAGFYLFGAKHADEATTARLPTLTPLLGPGLGGMNVTGSF